MKTKMAAVYVRVSSRRQKEEETIDSQVDALLGFAKNRGYEISEEWIFRDNGYSGASLERPGLDKLRDLAREGVLETVFVYSPDRLAREYVYQLIIHEEVQRFNVKLVYLKGDLETASPEGRMLAHFQGIFAEYERAQILDRTRRGRIFKVRQGDVSIFPKAPYGYNQERGESFFRIKENDARVVREIFRLYTCEKISLRQVCRRLEENGVLAPCGGVRWAPKTIQGILQNTAYIGTAYYGKKEKSEGVPGRIVRYGTRGKVERAIKATKLRSRDFWEPIRVESIIGESDFQMAEELLKRNRALAGRNTKHLSMLQGLLACGICGRSYYKKRRVKNGKTQTHYCCCSRLTRGEKNCGNRSIEAESFDKLVWDKIVDLLNNPSLIEEEIRRRCSEDQEKTHISGRKVDLRRELKQIEKARDKLLDAYQEGDCLTLAELTKRSKHLKEKETALKKELESLDALSIMKERYQDLAITLEAFKEKLGDSFDRLSMQDKQKIVRSLIEDIVVLPDEIEIKHIIPIAEPEGSRPLCGVVVGTASGDF